MSDGPFDHRRSAPREDTDGRLPDLGDFMDAVAADARGWYDTQRAYLVLAASERAGKLSAKVLLLTVCAILIGAAVIMCCIAFAVWLGRVLDDPALGFLAAGGILLVLTLVFYLCWRYGLRDRITLALINTMHEND